MEPIRQEDIVYSIKYICSRSDFFKYTSKLVDAIIDRCENPKTREDKIFSKGIKNSTIFIVGRAEGVDEHLILFVRKK